MGRGRPNGNQPAIARVPVLPVLAMLGAAAQDNVQYYDRAQDNRADGNGHIKRREVAVDVAGEVGILFVRLAFLFDCGHSLIGVWSLARASIACCTMLNGLEGRGRRMRKRFNHHAACHLHRETNCHRFQFVTLGVASPK